MMAEDPVVLKAAARWEKGSRIVRPTRRFRHVCDPELPPGASSGLVFLDDMTVFWNYRTLPGLALLDSLGDWICRVAIYDGALFVEAPYAEAQCDEPGRSKLVRLGQQMLESVRKEQPS